MNGLEIEADLVALLQTVDLRISNHEPVLVNQRTVAPEHLIVELYLAIICMLDERGFRTDGRLVIILCALA